MMNDNIIERLYPEQAHRFREETRYRDELHQLRQRCGEIATEILDHRETSYGDTPRTRELMLELADMSKGD